MEEQINAVQRMQNYIKDNIDNEITMAILASVSFFSPWYSYRIFKKYTGYTPADYIRRLRLSISAKRLKHEDVKIIDIAFMHGFKSVDGYTRAFCKEFGCNPSDYAKVPIPITLFIPYGVKIKKSKKEQIKMENLQSVFIQIIYKPKRKVIIKRAQNADDYFAYCEQVGCDVWGILSSMDSLGGEPVCLWLPKEYIKTNTSQYVQGVEVEENYTGIIPDGFEIITLPESEYLAFQGEPFFEENYSDAIMAVQQAMKKYNPSLIGYEWNDSSPRIQLEPRGQHGYIELRAIKSILTK